MSGTPDISEEYLKDTKIDDNINSSNLPRCESYEIPKSNDDSNIQTQKTIQDKSKESTEKDAVISEPPNKKQKTEKKIVGKPLTIKQLLEEVIQPDIAFLKESQIKIILLLEKIIRTNLVKNIEVNNLRCYETLSPK